ncbi:MAG: hypothetical protein ACR2FE_02320 [Aeromicrobium sp.]
MNEGQPEPSDPTYTPASDPRPLVVAGAVIGLTWAAALRGWMIQLAGDETGFHWFGTFALVLAPGLLVGALIGLAEHRRRTGGARNLWLTLAPCLFFAALADPTIFRQLITQGIGGGAIGVVLFGLAGGHALSGRGRAWWRRSCGVFAVIGVLFMMVLASDTAPLETAHGLWVGLYAASLLALLCVAGAIPHRIGRPMLVPTRWIAGIVGALAGFAWAAALRAFMWEVAGDEAGADWVGTFAWVLLPGAVIGWLLARAEHRRWTGSVPHRRWLIWSPMLFTAVLVHNPLDLASGFEGGIGLAAVAVPAICMLGGYAIAGRGPLWVRGACGLVLLLTIPIWSLTATDVGGSTMSLGNAHGAWAALLYWGLLATFSMAAAIPHRAPVVTVRPPASTPSARATG